jgi:hypothetical protein
MSTKELIEEGDKLLSNDWNEEDKELVKRMIDSLITYKYWIPKGLKQDIKDIIKLAHRIKNEYDDLSKKYQTLSIIENKECEIIEILKQSNLDNNLIESNIKESPEEPLS